ncbi:PAQR family membrane homeostasis protein TrhA [Bradyrhizobium sp. CCBAU 53415]|uniref:PAQR family membrane homeostasis protein TrhA n=1 Tax=Bradyrhizobium sp. CCBAU 53415 TaxID=1325119 RepID=UPI002304D22C|nr:hemolysin III family protein [Bradyrhizobium sp. CCBAU 53415]
METGAIAAASCVSASPAMTTPAPWPIFMRVTTATLKAHGLRAAPRRRPTTEPAAPIDWPYSPLEIRADLLIHGLGLCFGLSAVLPLLTALVRLQDMQQRAAVTIYLIGLLTALGTSAAFNLWPISPTKWLLRRFDHAAIYLLIAGTYMPFIVKAEQPDVRLIFLVSVWSATAAGVALKLFVPGRYDGLSIVAYLLMGWCGLTLCNGQAAALPASVSRLMIAGGVSFSVGIVFHLWRRLRFQNAIWHCFVLAGIVLHYLAILRIANDHA